MNVGERCLRCGSALWTPDRISGTETSPQPVVAWCLHHGCGGHVVVEVGRDGMSQPQEAGDG